MAKWCYGYTLHKDGTREYSIDCDNCWGSIEGKEEQLEKYIDNFKFCPFCGELMEGLNDDDITSDCYFKYGE
jgi:hypothetical protein